MQLQHLSIHGHRVAFRTAGEGPVLLREFARWYDTKAMSDRYALFDFAEHLERITTPILIIAGGRDALTPVRDLERVYRHITSPDKAFRIIGCQHGDAHEYSHADLILGVHAPDDVYPIILEWLENHRRHTTRGRAARPVSLRAVRRGPSALSRPLGDAGGTESGPVTRANSQS